MVIGPTLLLGDDKRIQWERRSLARWVRGLCAVEPRKRQSNSSVIMMLSPRSRIQHLNRLRNQLISREVK